MKWENKGHEFDDIGEFLANAKRVFLYGIGGHAGEILNILLEGRKWFDWEVKLADRNPELQLSGYRGLSVMNPEEIFSQIRDNDIVVYCPLGKTGEEIYGIIKEHGISDKNIFSGFDFMFTYIPVYFLYAKDMVFFTSQNIVPSTNCNLNCRDCLNFTPYIRKPVTYSLEELKKDIDLFFHAVDLIYRFQITGGEPLLYPRFLEVLDYVDKNYRDQILRLETVTNGTIIPSDEICSYLAEKKIYVYLDDYTMALKEEQKEKRTIIEEKFKKYGVDYLNNYVEQWFRIYTPGTIRENEKELNQLFTLCKNPYSTIEKGKISACNYALYAAKAGLIENDENDNYDLAIFDKSKKRELVEFRLRYNEKGYVSFCKKCSGYYLINESWCEPAVQVRKGTLDEVVD